MHPKGRQVLKDLNKDVLRGCDGCVMAAVLQPWGRTKRTTGASMQSPDTVAPLKQMFIVKCDV